MMLKTLPALAAIAAAAALVVPTVSHAAEKSSMRVSYADLNLTTDFGQNKLQRRVTYAARLVCDTAAPLDLKFEREVDGCRSGAVANAQPAIEAAIGKARHPSVEVLDGAALIVTAR
jgi:UrcA family protein